ncbi:hypothetical protein LTR35_018237, partial [Friedmanniomyces endolithicus]
MGFDSEQANHLRDAIATANAATSNLLGDSKIYNDLCAFAAEHKTTSKAWRTKKTNDKDRDIETIEYRLPILTEDAEDLSVRDSADDDYVATPSKKDEEKHQNDDDEEGSDGEESRYNAARSRGL